KAAACQQFITRVFEVEEVRALEILTRRACAQIEYTNGVVPCHTVIQKISRHLKNGLTSVRASQVNAPSDLLMTPTDNDQGWRVVRHGRRLSTWEIKHELPGRIRLRNGLIRGRSDLCSAIERGLMRTRG